VPETVIDGIDSPGLVVRSFHSFCLIYSMYRNWLFTFGRKTDVYQVDPPVD